MEFNMKKIKVGMVVEGTVFMVTEDSVHLDFGSYAEGVIYKSGLSLKEIKSCKDLVKEGDVLQATITKIDDMNQQILLTRRDVLKQEQLQKVNTFIETTPSFEAKVRKSTRGGLVLDYQGVELFLPTGQIDTAFVNQEDFLNQKLTVTVIENDGRKIVVSRRKIIEETLKQNIKQEFDSLNIGDEVTAEVVKLAEFGAFVKLNHVQGLIHKSELSHHRTEKVSDEVNVGDTVTCEVISKAKGKLGLSIKKRLKTPWQLFSEKAKIGDEITGTVVRKMATGMLIEVERDVVGIIMKKDYSWDPRTNLAGEVQVGSPLTLKILSMDPDNRKMSLSKKHLDYNPWKDITIKEGQEVSGTVDELQSRGALVEVHGVKAFLPISEISSEHITEVNQVLKVGEVINAVVKEVDKEEWKMVISIKDLVEGKQRSEYEAYLKTEEKATNPTLGDMFKEQLEKYKK